jgi:hypothetical protein
VSKLTTIHRAEWKAFFDRLSDTLLGKWAEVEVASLGLGDQIVAEWVPMYGITYDSKDDLLDVAFDRFNHFIRHPQDIVVEEDTSGVISVAVVDREGEKQVVRLKQPLALSQPTGTHGRG